MNIQTGDIILVRGNTPIISPLIRWFTDSEYTHVAMAITPGWVYEIDIDRKLSIHPMEHKNYDVFRYKNGLTNEQKRTLMLKALERAKGNKGYDWLHILSFAFQKLFYTKKAFQEANKVICSEIVDYLYGDIEIDLIPNQENGHVAPANFPFSPELVKVFSHICS